MKGQWESNINVRFWFMYSQKWNSLFPKKNYSRMFCLPISTFMYLWAIYIFLRSVVSFIFYVSVLWAYNSITLRLQFINQTSFKCKKVQKRHFRFSPYSLWRKSSWYSLSWFIISCWFCQVLLYSASPVLWLRSLSILCEKEGGYVYYLFILLFMLQ